MEGIIHFTRALELTAPHHVDQRCSFLILRGDAYDTAGRSDLAQADYREVRRLSPRFHEPYVQYANELETSGAKTEALALRAFISKLFA